jgi:hypothetical protein
MKAVYHFDDALQEERSRKAEVKIIALENEITFYDSFNQRIKCRAFTLLRERNQYPTVTPPPPKPSLSLFLSSFSFIIKPRHRTPWECAGGLDL